MNIPSPRSSRRARIEIIPLIDIVFFLLATFVLVSLSMIKNQAIPVNLPVAASGVAQERQESIALSVTETGEFYFNKEPLGLEEIVRRLEELKAGDPKVFISGDARAEFGKAVALLDEVRRLGITKVSIQTRSK